MKEFAARLNDRERGVELTSADISEARQKGYVVVYGASDDLMYFDGAWRDDFGCYNGGTAFVNSKGLFVSECEDDDCPYAQREEAKCKCIVAVWHNEADPCWTYETDIPHETFMIYDDGEQYCRGIVFRVEDV